jgi:tetratricopeptide (TPR) repeat protein
MATPAENASVFGHDNIVVQANGSGVNVTVQAGRAHLRLTQYEQRTRLAARGDSEAALLSAYRADVAPLVGCEGAMADLRRWLDGEAPVSMRALIGAGGRGKTRLAVELARRISSEGWLAGFVTAEELDRFRAQHNVAEWRWDKPVLVIVDYAASRAEQIRAWARELADAAFEDGRPGLRLLLIERQASRAIGWLATILGGGDDASRAVSALFDPPEPVELPAIDDLEFRRQIFAALLSRGGGLAAPALGADAEFDRLLADRKWAGDPLYLGMAGLVAGRAGVREALSLSRADLALEVAERELKRIGDIGAAHGVDAAFQNHRGAFVRHLAAMATLTQGLTREEARGLAEGELSALRSSAPLNASLEALRDALPGAGANGGVAPILPDIVGEGAILAWLGDGGPVVAEWGLPSAARIAAAAQTRLPRVSAVLVRIAQDFAPAGRDEPVRWLESLAATSDADVGALMQIADELPDRTLALRELAARLNGRIADMLRGAVAASEAEDNADDRGASFALHGRLAAWLNRLGNRLGDLGRREDALAAAREATDIYRRLAADRPDAFLPDLAMSLTNLGGRLRDFGRREDALAAAREAVEIFRRFAADRPDAFLPYLVASLNNLGIFLSELGRREEALAPTREASDIVRRLAASRPDAFLPYLAASLHNLADRLDELGRREEALAAAREAVEIRRRLAADRPDAFLSYLAMSLNNLGNGLSKLGRREDALAVVREAVEIRRRLAAGRPDAFLPDLASSLNNLGARLSELGRREDALAAAREASEIYRCLAAGRPDAVLPDFALSLNNLGVMLSALGRGEEALAAAREAVEIRRRLAADRPDAFLPDLATSLNNLGATLGGLGRREEALAAAREAVATLAPFFLRLSAAHAQWMAKMVGNYLKCCKESGVEPDAELLGPIAEVFKTLPEFRTANAPPGD